MLFAVFFILKITRSLFFLLQGLEKYVMTKLFNRAFASLPEERKHDEELSEKMACIQQFIRPENLDIKPTFQRTMRAAACHRRHP